MCKVSCRKKIACQPLSASNGMNMLIGVTNFGPFEAPLLRFRDVEDREQVICTCFAHHMYAVGFPKNWSCGGMVDRKNIPLT